MPSQHAKPRTQAQLDAFAAELEQLKREITAQLGATDLEYIKRVRSASRISEWLGRGLISLSADPVSFTSGVLLLWFHKQVEATELGHTVMHGVYDELPGSEGLRSTDMTWELPIDQESWHRVHNVLHHGHTGIVGRDPDLQFGFLRLSEAVPFERIHAHPWLTTFFTFPAIGFVMNLHVTGLEDLLLRPADRREVLANTSAAERRAALRRFFRQAAPYYWRNFVLLPALTGPLFAKTLAGNVLAELLRGIYTSITIHCGHLGPELRAYPAGSRAHSKAEWYVMQIEATQNFEVPWLLSLMCGGLDYHIEHHLFPKLPPNRLREIAPRVRELCERHDIRYRSATWPTVIRGVARQVARLAQPVASRKRSFAALDLLASPLRGRAREALRRARGLHAARHAARQTEGATLHTSTQSIRIEPLGTLS
jgi:NADPH-dependent stearoyl-CoA 9-desaturase